MRMSNIPTIIIKTLKGESVHTFHVMQTITEETQIHMDECENASIHIAITTIIRDTFSDNDWE